MPSSRRYFEEVARVIEQDRLRLSIATLEFELFPDPVDWSQSTHEVAADLAAERPLRR